MITILYRGYCIPEMISLSIACGYKPSFATALLSILTKSIAIFNCSTLQSRFTSEPKFMDHSKASNDSLRCTCDFTKHWKLLSITWSLFRHKGSKILNKERRQIERGLLFLTNDSCFPMTEISTVQSVRKLEKLTWLLSKRF